MVPLGDEWTSACRAAASSVRLSPTTPCAVTSTMLAPGDGYQLGPTLSVIATWPGKRVESNTTSLGKFAAIFHAFPVEFEFVTVLARKLAFAAKSIWTAELE